VALDLPLASANGPDPNLDGALAQQPSEGICSGQAG